MFNWLFGNRKKRDSIAFEATKREVAMRGQIADKLRHYNPEEDTTISEFSLADDVKGTKSTSKMKSGTESDVWGQANPRETGKWNKEVRKKSGST
jgi:hypothetical protein